MLLPVWLETLRSTNDGGREGLTIDTNCVSVDASVADALRILQPCARDEAANSTCALPCGGHYHNSGCVKSAERDRLIRFSRYYSGNAVTANMMESKCESVAVLPLCSWSRAAPGGVWLFRPGFSYRLVPLVAGSRLLDGPRADYVWMTSLFHFVLPFLLPK